MVATIDSEGLKAYQSQRLSLVANEIQNKIVKTLKNYKNIRIFFFYKKRTQLNKLKIISKNIMEIGILQRISKTKIEQTQLFIYKTQSRKNEKL